MKVLHVTNAYPFPGIPEYGVFVKEQIAALARAGVEVDTVFVNAKRDGKKAYLDGVAKVREAAIGSDLVHCHHVYSSFVARLAGVRAPIVVSFQNSWPHEVELSSKFLQRLLCNIGVSIADRVIFKSPIPMRFRNNAKFVHLPNGVDERAFNVSSKCEARARLNLDQLATYALFVSSKDQFRPQKRYDRFVETLAIVRTRNPDIDLRELVMVNQPRECVSDFFNSADLHLLCSDFEGSPNSVKEALCTGLPVVTTPAGNTVEMLKGVPGCYAAGEFSALALAELVERSLADCATREDVRTTFLEKGLNEEEVTSRLRELYHGLLQEKSMKA